MVTKALPIIPEKQFQSFMSSLRGNLICIGDDEYETARPVYNAMIDRYPAYIVQAADVSDVITAVNFARENKISLAIRGGGHNGAGLGTVDDGLVVDLKDMHGIRVNPEDRTVRVEGGATWGEVDHATHPFGLAVPSGIISTTGVGGLTLGGGIGHLSRKYGLTIDNLIEVDLVLADGRFITANSSKNSDLFWAVRGGGGNFGVVTSFLYRLSPVSMVYAGPMFWELEKAPQVLRWYRDFITRAPEDLNGFFAFLAVPPAPPFPEEWRMKQVCAIAWTYTGPQDKAESVFKPIRQQFGNPIIDFVGPMPYPALQGMFTPLFPPGQQWYWRADFVNEISDEAIAQHMRFGSMLPSWQSTMHLYPISGAVHRVGRKDTAFSYRESNWAQVMVGVDPDPANAEKISQWSKDYFTALHPYSAGGSYVNFLGEVDQERVKSSYRENYDRLAEVKKKYDPSNFFHVNQNIHPKS